MVAWEYWREDEGSADLARLGAEGWELCAAVGHTLYFKRPALSLQERIALEQRAEVLGSGLPLGAHDRPPEEARPRLLHPGLRAALASVGHTDLILVADRGFPVPPEVPRIDLALTDDVPTVLQVLRCVAGEVRLDRVLVAEEATRVSPAYLEALRGAFPSVPCETMPHLRFKSIARTARVAVRTGDATPYANVLVAIG
jgi:D-ribose pyranase